MKGIFFKLIILFLISIIPVALFNYFIDPYGIFNNTSLNLEYLPGYEPNQHYAKMRHIIYNKYSWDSYIFGSSRVGKLNPDLIPGGNYYNMNYSEAMPGEHLEDIKILLRKGVPVKNVIIGLDNYSYLVRPEDHRWQIPRHPYDDSTFKRIFFQIKYLFSAPQINIVKYTKSKENEFFINYNILGNGMPDLDKVDKNIESNIEQHVKNSRFNITGFDKAFPYEFMNTIDNTIQDITEIISLSKRYHFNLYFFINPLHKLYYLWGNPYNFLLFKEKLAQVANYWDFSGFNAITTNNYYFYETSHYRTITGDFVIYRMFNCTDVKAPEDFGVYVTKANVNQHIRKQRDELIAIGIRDEINSVKH